MGKRVCGGGWGVTGVCVCGQGHLGEQTVCCSSGVQQCGSRMGVALWLSQARDDAQPSAVRAAPAAWCWPSDLFGGVPAAD